MNEHQELCVVPPAANRHSPEVSTLLSIRFLEFSLHLLDFLRRRPSEVVGRLDLTDVAAVRGTCHRLIELRR